MGGAAGGAVTVPNYQMRQWTIWERGKGLTRCSGAKEGQGQTPPVPRRRGRERGRTGEESLRPAPKLFIGVQVPKVASEAPEPPSDKQAQARPQLSRMH